MPKFVTFENLDSAFELVTRLWYDEIEISGDIPLRTDDNSSDVSAAP